MDYKDTLSHIRHIKRGIYTHVDAKLKKLDINLVSTQISIILFLYYNKKTKITDLAENIDTTNSTANYMVKKLEEEGLVTKNQDSLDKRIFYVELTKKSLDNIDFYIDIMKENLDMMYKEFTNIEKDMFFKLLEKMSKNF